MRSMVGASIASTAPARALRAGGRPTAPTRSSRRHTRVDHATDLTVFVPRSSKEEGGESEEGEGEFMREDDGGFRVVGRRESVAGSLGVGWMLTTGCSAARAGVLSSAVAEALRNGGGDAGESDVAEQRRFGLVEYDSPELDYSFRYPRGWKSLRNRLRRGVIVSDFNTTDKAYVEVFSRPPVGELAAAAAAVGGGEETEAFTTAAAREAERLVIRARAVEVLVAPVDNDNSGDSKLEVPSMRGVKTLDVGNDAAPFVTDSRRRTYDYFTFTSNTTTRSGYEVARRNYAAVVSDPKTGLVYAMCCSTTTDGFSDQKAAMFRAMVRSFVVL